MLTGFPPLSRNHLKNRYSIIKRAIPTKIDNRACSVSSLSLLFSTGFFLCLIFLIFLKIFPPSLTSYLNYISN
nr:MAG TPA: hypothetical protein [Caudoviricetes sp.]